LLFLEADAVRVDEQDHVLLLWLCRSKAFGFSDEKCFTSIQKEAVNWLDLDHAEHRYLLAASSDCSVTGYDVAVPSHPRSHHTNATHEPLFKIDKSSSGGHKYAITCVAWYPVDTGLFISGGHDQEVKVGLGCLCPSCLEATASLVTHFQQLFC
jgi:WD40 repeat protein